MLTRHGTTLPELLVALAVAGLVLGTAGKSLLQQQRTSRRVAGAASIDAQSRGAAALVRTQLSFVAPRAGDLSGLASDTALQLRVPVALGVVCASSAGAATLSADDADESPSGATTSPPQPGDSLWWHLGAESGWLGRRIAGVQGSADGCPPLRAASVATLRVQLAALDTLPPAAAVRITRQIRYAFYGGGSGSWQLGSREWSDATRQFAAPQPIAGPFVRRSPTGDRTGFRYFDADDVELGVGGTGVDAQRIARIQLTLLGRDAGSPPRARDVRREQVEIAVRGSVAP